MTTPHSMMTRADCVALLEQLSLEELIALNAWTAQARTDDQYLALVEIWYRLWERRATRRGSRKGAV